MPEILINPELEALVRQGAPVAVGISGGKDSGALALALTDYLDSVGHPKEQRVLVHADLGIIEWPESLEWCERLAEFLGLPLLQVERKAGGLVERWESRWAANWLRYVNLECLKLILPWSTASMRFCTSELKTDVICRALRARWPTGTIISACGIRAEESPHRAKAPISKEQKKLSRKGHLGLDWNPILHWTLADVLAIHEEKGFPLHPAYTDFGASRVSCSMCILATLLDQLAALKNPGNHPAYIRLCRLELASGFSFQSSRWLCDLDPILFAQLIPEGPELLVRAKMICKTREELEAQLPKSALFVAGKPWPPAKISRADAEIIASVRTQIFALYGVTQIEDPETIQSLINSRVVEPELAAEATDCQFELCL